MGHSWHSRFMLDKEGPLWFSHVLGMKGFKCMGCLHKIFFGFVWRKIASCKFHRWAQLQTRAWSTFFYHGKIWNGEKYPFPNGIFFWHLIFWQKYDTQLAKGISESNGNFFHIYIFCHFKFCHIRRSGFWLLARF